MRMEYVSAITRRMFYGIIAVLILLVIFTPYLIDHGIFMLSEEVVEVSIESGLIATLLFVRHLMTKEILARERTLQELYREFGKMNIQIAQINDIFSKHAQVPNNKKDIRHALALIAEKILAILPTDWVFLRIVDMETGRTLSECIRARGAAVVIKHEIGNKDLLNRTPIRHCITLSSGSQNVNIKTFCVFPRTTIDHVTKMFIIGLLNYIDMIYLIFTSKRFKR